MFHMTRDRDSLKLLGNNTHYFLSMEVELIKVTQALIKDDIDEKGIIYIHFIHSIPIYFLQRGLKRVTKMLWNELDFVFLSDP